VKEVVGMKVMPLEFVKLFLSTVHVALLSNVTLDVLFGRPLV
jgi:hypothetical protein